eukprot:3568288-Pyramimonas_sp.AAC.1
MLAWFARSPPGYCSLPRLCLEGFLLSMLKGSGSGPRPGRFPPGSAPRPPQLRPLSLALLISS